jgi:hypothetical protein
MTNKLEVEQFLKQLKQHLSIWQVIFINRPKNQLQALADLEITPKKREDIIKNLTYKNYSEGPKLETQYGGAGIWIFGKTIKTQELYIKLTISRETQNVICISFHKAEYPMDYPLN